MVPICMVNEETLNQLPDDVRQYLRVLRRRILELEQTDAQQRIAELEAANRKLRAQVDVLLGLAAHSQLPFAGWATNRADGSLSALCIACLIPIPGYLFAL